MDEAAILLKRDLGGRVVVEMQRFNQLLESRRTNFTKGRGWLAAKERKDSGRVPFAFSAFFCGKSLGYTSKDDGNRNLE